MLALKNVTKAYGNNKVLAGASFDVRPKDNVCIVGEGGSGKSTILRLLARAEDPTAGVIAVDGIDLKAVPAPILQLYRRRLGIAFQEPMLLLHATVAENIALPLELFGAPENIMKRMADDLMKRFNLTGKASRLAADLSQSEKSLMGIARAIIASPMIIVADEPLQHLDAAQAKTVIELFKNMHKHGCTLILFSRSAQTAKAFGARVVDLKDGVLTAATEAPSTRGSTTHRILEETEQKIHSVMETEPVDDEPKPVEKKHVVKKPPTDGGKKIRITSIGSDL